MQNEPLNFVSHTSQLIQKIREKEAKTFHLSILIERSESLEWVILTNPEGRQIAIHWTGTYFKTNTIEGYTGTGFIAALTQDGSTEHCRKTIRTYFRHGYEKVFEQMLRARFKESKTRPGITVEELWKQLDRTRKNDSKRKTKPVFMEIPPSLKDTVAEKLGEREI